MDSVTLSSSCVKQNKITNMVRLLCQTFYVLNLLRDPIKAFMLDEQRKIDKSRIWICDLRIDMPAL